MRDVGRGREGGWRGRGSELRNSGMGGSSCCFVLSVVLLVILDRGRGRTSQRRRDLGCRVQMLGLSRSGCDGMDDVLYAVPVDYI